MRPHKVGPSPPRGCSLGGFDSSPTLGIEFQVGGPISDFKGDDGISSPSFTYASSLENGLTLDSPEDVSTIANLPFPLVPLGEPKKREDLMLSLVLIS